MKLHLQLFAEAKTGKAQRKESILFYIDNPGEGETFEAIGKDNDELSRTMNYEADSKENVLGETDVTVKKGPQTTSVDPCYYTRDGKLAQKLYEIYKYDKELDDVVFEFMEVSVFKETEEPAGEYECFRQKAAISLQSWGGDTAGVGTPYELNWLGPKTHGTFNPKTKKFTATVIE